MAPPSCHLTYAPVCSLKHIHAHTYTRTHAHTHTRTHAHTHSLFLPPSLSATRAFDAIRLTYVEELVDVGCSILAVNVLRAHPLSRAVYNAIIVYLLVELHCG